MRVRDSRRDWLGPDLVASLTPDEQRMIERYGGEDWLPLFPTTRKAVTAARAGASAGRV